MIDFKKFQQDVHSLRSAILRMVDEHERDHHEGKACMATRNGVIAFFAHSLGYTANRFVEEAYLIAAMTYEYEADCPGCQELPIQE